MVNYRNPKPHFEDKKPPRRPKRVGGYFSKETIKKMMKLIDEGKKAREEYYRDNVNAAVC
ncbi:hypothetical protein L6272_06595 [Microgenomates group bacterium]|nr:hypothetical protein [Microgenomates group bacterium]